MLQIIVPYMCMILFHGEHDDQPLDVGGIPHDQPWDEGALKRWFDFIGKFNIACFSDALATYYIHIHV